MRTRGRWGARFGRWGHVVDGEQVGDVITWKMGTRGRWGAYGRWGNVVNEDTWEMGARGRWGHVGDGDEEGEWEQVDDIERDVEEDGSTWEMEREMGSRWEKREGGRWGHVEDVEQVGEGSRKRERSITLLLQLGLRHEQHDKNYAPCQYRIPSLNQSAWITLRTMCASRNIRGKARGNIPGNIWKYSCQNV